MTIAYFDASALVKLLIEEVGSEDVEQLWNGAGVLVTSRVTDVEVTAALAAARRAHRLDDDMHETAEQTWQQLRRGLRLVEVTPELSDAAGDLAKTCALGALDALHLASAVTLNDVDIIFSSWDRRLLEAAHSLGIITMPAALGRDS